MRYFSAGLTITTMLRSESDLAESTLKPRALSESQKALKGMFIDSPRYSRLFFSPPQANRVAATTIAAKIFFIIILSVRIETFLINKHGIRASAD